MPRASVTPKGASTPAGSLGKRQIGEAAARRRIAPLIEGFERLIAMGCQPPAGSMVHIMGKHYLRDLAPVRTIDPSIVASAVGATRRGRRPVTVTLLLNARSFVSVERHLSRATPEEDAEVERLASHALDLQTAKRHAAAVKADAYAHREGLSASLSLLSRAPHTPARRRRAAVVAEFHAEASRAYSAAEVAAVKAGNALRRHLGQPLARPGHANQSRHRVARGRKRYARWWNPRRGQKLAHGAPTGLGSRFSEIGESARFYFAGAAAYTFGSVLAFTLNLDGERSARALKSGRPAGWLLDRIRKELRAKLGRDVPVALAVELSTAGLVHAHGFLAGCTMAEASPITGAMCRAGGSTYRGTDQLDLKPSPDSGWASYGVKDALKTVQAFGDAHRVAISADLNGAAAAVYAEVVTFVTHPGKQQPAASEDQSILTFVRPEQNNVKNLNKAHCVRRLTELPLDCGQQREAIRCKGRQSLLTGSPTCSKEWRFGRGPTLDSC